MRNQVDAVRLEIIRSALVAAAEEMSVAVFRAGRSNAIREMLDFSTAVFDANGQNVAQAARIPMHLNTMAPCLETILARHIPAEAWAEGDVVVTNDPYCGGSHLPDVLTFRAVFHDGQRIGFAGTMCHHTDIGGGAPGSYNAAATEIFAEGVRIPPLKIKRQGVLNDDLLAFLLQNVREPATLKGDLVAQIAALDLGAVRMIRIAERYGRDILLAASRQILELSEQAVRRAIAAVPDGVYAFEDFVDSDGISDQPVRIAAQLTITGDRLVVDLTGSSPQTAGPINCTLNVAKCAIYYATIAGLGGEFHANSGCYLPIAVIAPEGTVVNALSPASVVNRINVGHRIVNVILGALAQARPGRIPAAYYGVSYLYAVQAIDPAMGRSVYLDSIVGGWGAEPTRDGAHVFSCGLHNLASIPIEMIESRHPITFTRYAIRQDSGGAGRFRGGNGMVREFRLDAADGSLAANFDRFRFTPFGLEGGQPGAAGRLVLVRDGAERDLPAKLVGLRLQQGDIIRVETSGGGGYGPAADRDGAAVGRDIAAGYVSPAAATSAYGRSEGSTQVHGA
ncbi:MAG: hydantoinase B/oxoprolinase family protein [Alphaproteobacteria bacterium]|nr:hydantoinase B/oxoprolinase family protein [Alphaproteobacteria bacterium]